MKIRLAKKIISDSGRALFRLHPELLDDLGKHKDFSVVYNKVPIIAKAHTRYDKYIKKRKHV